MTEHTLDCCVVRDLLPSYIEELTEEETTTQVRHHLEHCEACRETECAMRTEPAVEAAPKNALAFLRHIKRTRLLAAALTVAVTLLTMWGLYDMEYHYPNTEAGRLAAAEDYALANTSSTLNGPKKGTPISVPAWQEKDGHLFLFYMTESEDNVYGMIHLVQGINGKYQPIEASIRPSQFSGGIYPGRFTPKDTDWDFYYLAGYNCRDIYSAEVQVWSDFTYQNSPNLVKRYDLSATDFLDLIDVELLAKELEVKKEEATYLHFDDRTIRLYDKDGNDITAEYKDESIKTNWGGSKDTVERFVLYVYLFIVAAMGVIMVRYFLRKD